MIAASKIWKIGRLYIKSAFLQGQKIERDVYLKPLKEAGTDRLWNWKDHDVFIETADDGQKRITVH